MALNLRKILLLGEIYRIDILSTFGGHHLQAVVTVCKPTTHLDQLAFLFKDIFWHAASILLWWTKQEYENVSPRQR